MSRVFWDTNLFIYLFEDYGALSEKVAGLRKRMLERNDNLLTSTLTLGEILVKPVEKKDAGLCAKYEQAITATATTVAFDIKAAKIYAELRSNRTLRAPDAIQLACAGAAATDLFITNDERLQGKRAPGIQFIVSLERVPI